ncbi:hypothetical protein N7450_011765 [Penicillium hetheringtonii]|uniref:HTH CENPB-type domain-containing protein n=1 Tax=Penicillium hetheringtonii TaxID=911720 RepID=A0AAD6DCP6_9EURO|nr:hypothetical protein N7450_011765 [Penicillium hetheringtonii]
MKISNHYKNDLQLYSIILLSLIGLIIYYKIGDLRSLTIIGLLMRLIYIDYKNYLFYQQICPLDIEYFAVLKYIYSRFFYSYWSSASQCKKVLSKLNISLQISTPPNSQSSSRSNQFILKISKTIIQLYKQSPILKNPLHRRSNSPPSPIKSILDQIIKNTALSLYNTVLLAQENIDLRAANEKIYIFCEKSLNIKESLQLIAQLNLPAEAPAIGQLLGLYLDIVDIGRLATESIHGKILLALNNIKNSRIKSIHTAAKLYKIFYITLYIYSHSRVLCADIYPNSHKLIQFEEDLLAEWIISIDICGAASRSATVEEMANILFAVCGSYSLSTVGKNWLSIFINRCPELCIYFLRRYDYQRALNKDLKSIQQWFATIQNIIDENSIQPENIYNFDEIEFAMDFIANQKIIICTEYYSRRFLLQPENCE